MNMLEKAEKMYKKKAVRNAVTCAAVLVSALLQSFVIQTFIRPAELLSGGFTGIAILVDIGGVEIWDELSDLPGDAGV